MQTSPIDSYKQVASTQIPEPPFEDISNWNGYRIFIFKNPSHFTLLFEKITDHSDFFKIRYRNNPLNVLSEFYKRIGNANESFSESLSRVVDRKTKDPCYQVRTPCLGSLNTFFYDWLKEQGSPVESEEPWEVYQSLSPYPELQELYRHRGWEPQFSFFTNPVKEGDPTNYDQMLTKAVRESDMKLAEILVAHYKADLDCKGADGKSARDILYEMGKAEEAEKLANLPKLRYPF